MNYPRVIGPRSFLRQMMFEVNVDLLIEMSSGRVQMIVLCPVFC